MLHDLGTRAQKFWQSLVSERLSETAHCKACGSLMPKNGMVQVQAIGWFCNESELDAYRTYHGLTAETCKPVERNPVGMPASAAQIKLRKSW